MRRHSSVSKASGREEVSRRREVMSESAAYAEARRIHLTGDKESN